MRWFVGFVIAATFGCAGLDQDDDEAPPKPDAAPAPAPDAEEGGDEATPPPQDMVDKPAPKVAGLPKGYEPATIVEPPEDTNHDFDQDGKADRVLWAVHEGDQHMGLVVLLTSGDRELLGFDKDLSSFGRWEVGEDGTIAVLDSNGDKMAEWWLDDHNRHTDHH